MPDYARAFFEKCVLKKNTTEKAEIIADERVSHFIEITLNQNLGKIDTTFRKTDELNKYLIKTIKSL